MTFKIPAHIEELKPYVPGRHVSEIRREFGLKRIVKLASNENPNGPSPKAFRAVLKARKNLTRYPDASYFELHEVVAQKFGLQTEELVFGNGSNELIELFIRCFCERGEKILIQKHGFVAYSVCAKTLNVPVVVADVDEQLRVKPDSVLEKIQSDPGIKIVFLANPGNPTPGYLTQETLYSLLRRIRELRGDSILVVLDDAYGEYMDGEDAPDAIQAFRDFAGMVGVLRTFSKAYGLAGLRVGYGILPAHLCGYIEKSRIPFNLSVFSEAVTIAALQDEKYLKKTVEINRKEKKKWELFFEQHHIPYIPSGANYHLIETVKVFKKTGGELAQECLRKGLILRPVNNYQLPNYLRISIGNPSENKFAQNVLRQFL